MLPPTIDAVPLEAAPIETTVSGSLSSSNEKKELMSDPRIVSVVSSGVLTKKPKATGGSLTSRIVTVNDLKKVLELLLNPWMRTVRVGVVSKSKGTSATKTGLSGSVMLSILKKLLSAAATESERGPPELSKPLITPIGLF